jgi:hypothetical protein
MQGTGNSVVTTECRRSWLTVIVRVDANIQRRRYNSYESKFEIELPDRPALRIKDLEVLGRFSIGRTRWNQAL